MENSLELVLWWSTKEAFARDVGDTQRECELNLSIVHINDLHTGDKKCVCTSSDALGLMNVTVSKSNTSDKLYDFCGSQDRALKENSRQFGTTLQRFEAPSRYLDSRKARISALSQHVSRFFQIIGNLSFAKRALVAVLCWKGHIVFCFTTVDLLSSALGSLHAACRKKHI